MAGFNIKELLNEQSKKTHEAAGSGFSVREIPINRIVPTKSNKYGIRDIEELAASIESMGLLHNLVVNEINGDGYYELISGERRFLACQMLFNGGNHQYTTIPCKVEKPENPTISELKLIHANATARELTDYEKTYQASRIKELLQQLKADGYKFKGRMRELVADMLNVSPAQMGRMESINKNLSAEVTEEFKAGKIGITAAYEISTLPEAAQSAALNEYKTAGGVKIKHSKNDHNANQPAQPSNSPVGSVETTPLPVQKITNYERIRNMSIEKLASFISSIEHACDYENDDYDPSIMAWLKAVDEDAY